MKGSAWVRLGVALLAGLGPAVASAALAVAVSVLPQKTFVERIGGERVSVQVMVTPGASPDTYDPSPRQLAALTGARLYFSVGVPFEGPWLPRLRRASPQMEVVDLRAGLFQQLFDNSPQGILLLGKDGAPMDINPSTTTTTATSRAMGMRNPQTPTCGPARAG